MQTQKRKRVLIHRYWHSGAQKSSLFQHCSPQATATKPKVRRSTLRDATRTDFAAGRVAHDAFMAAHRRDHDSTRRRPVQLRRPSRPLHGADSRVPTFHPLSPSSHKPSSSRPRAASRTSPIVLLYFPTAPMCEPQTPAIVHPTLQSAAKNWSNVIKIRAYRCVRTNKRPVGRGSFSKGPRRGQIRRHRTVGRVFRPTVARNPPDSDEAVRLKPARERVRGV